MSTHINTVHILGLGALGCLYASKLIDSKAARVKIIASEERAAALKGQEIRVNDKAYTFDFAVPGTDQESAQLIIVAVKAHQLEAAIADLSPFIGENTVVISLLNGISSEELIGAKIGYAHLLYAYGVGMDALREGTAVFYKNPGRVVFGEKDNAIVSSRVKAVKALFDLAAIPCHVPVNMYRALWVKFMMNVGINQASAVLRAPFGAFQEDEEAVSLLRAAAGEVIALSQKMNINLDASDLDDVFKIIHTLNPSGKTSMLQDVEAGRPTEVEIFAGKVIELGKEYGLPTPVNEMLYRRILAGGPKFG